MPYIDPEKRRHIDNDYPPENAGELNYLLTTIILDYLASQAEIKENSIAYIKSNTYAHYNEVIGVLECIKQELWTRIIRPYEDDKIRINGDIFDELPTERNLSWAAGLFEGEGCFVAHYGKERKDGKKLLRTGASLVQKDREILDWFKNIVGFGIVYLDNKCFVWKTTRVGEAAKLLEWFRPWLSNRRIKKAEELLKKEKEQTIYPVLPYCPAGHKYTIKNTIKYPGRKGRICKICRNQYAKLWRSKQPAGYWRKYVH